MMVEENIQEVDMERRACSTVQALGAKRDWLAAQETADKWVEKGWNPWLPSSDKFLETSQIKLLADGSGWVWDWIYKQPIETHRKWMEAAGGAKMPGRMLMIVAPFPKTAQDLFNLMVESGFPPSTMSDVGDRYKLLYRSKADMAENLVKKQGFDFNELKAGMTPADKWLDLCCSGGKEVEEIKVLMNLGGKPTQDGINSAWEKAVSFELPKAAEALEEFGLKPDIKASKSVLRTIIRRGDSTRSTRALQKVLGKSFDEMLKEEDMSMIIGNSLKEGRSRIASILEKAGARIDGELLKQMWTEGLVSDRFTKESSLVWIIPRLKKLGVDVKADAYDAANIESKIAGGLRLDPMRTMSLLERSLKHEIISLEDISQIVEKSFGNNERVLSIFQGVFLKTQACKPKKSLPRRRI